MRAFFFIMAVILICSSCSNKGEAKQQSEQSVNEFGEPILTEEEEVALAQDSETYMEERRAKMWTVGYFKDEFGDEDKSDPYIETIIDGTRDGRPDCQLNIRMSKGQDVIMQMAYNNAIEDMAGLTIKVQHNGVTRELPYDEVTDNNLIYIHNGQVIRELLEMLDSEGSIKFSFYTDAYSIQHNRVFELYAPTGVMKALQKIGVINGN